MEPSTLYPELARLARGMDLYARRHQILFAIGVGELDLALSLCRASATDCEKRLAGARVLIDRIHHEQNLVRLRLLAAQLSSAMRAYAMAEEPEHLAA
jgi:hypothetical protein